MLISRYGRNSMKMPRSTSIWAICASLSMHWNPLSEFLFQIITDWFLSTFQSVRTTWSTALTFSTAWRSTSSGLLRLQETWETSRKVQRERITARSAAPWNGRGKFSWSDCSSRRGGITSNRSRGKPCWKWTPIGRS